MRLITEHRLIKAGITYRELGFEWPDGRVPAVKLAEFLAVDEEIEKAQKEKQNRLNKAKA